MIDRTHSKLSVGAQCRLLSISRSSFNYAPQGETAMNLDLMLMRSIFSDEKKLSMAALSQTSPSLLIEQVIPCALSKAWNWALVYWLP